MYDDWEDNSIDLELIFESGKYNKVILLDARPYDPQDIFVYRAVLTKSKSDLRESWMVNLIIRGHDHWRLSSAQWSLDSLLHYFEATQEDVVFVNLEKNRYVHGMQEVVEEAYSRVMEENFHDKQKTELVKEKPQDYSKMKKWEIQKEVDAAIDRGDQETLQKLAPYISESLKMPSIYEYLKFKRHIEPKDAMSTGVPRCKKCGKVIKDGDFKKDICKKCADLDWQKQILHDDLRSNFRSWQGGCTQQELNNLIEILRKRYPKLSISYIEEVAKDWCEPINDEVDECKMPSILQYLNESMSKEEHLYWNQKGRFQKEHEYFWDKLVPSQGQSESIQGELLRNFTRIMYDRYNNGFGNSRENEGRFIAKYRDLITPYLKDPEILIKFLGMYKGINYGEDYYMGSSGWQGDKYFDPIMDAILEYVMDSEELDPLPKEDIIPNYI